MKRLFLTELYFPALFQMTISLIRNLHLYRSKSKSDDHVFSRTDCVATGSRQFSACMRSVCLPCISITSILCLQTKSDKELVFIDSSILILSLKLCCIYIFVKTTVGSLLSNNPERSRCDLRNDVIN